jgi:hypothetical protein
LRGDIDGDGIDDLARLVGTTAGGRGCSYTLEVATQSGPATTEIDVDSWGGKQMTPLLLAQIDASPGLEIVVEIGRGASSESAQIFSMSEQSLHPLTFSDEPDPNFTFSGSVCCGGAIDCLPGQSGQIVLSSYGYNKSADGYVVTRRFYQVQGSAFELMDSQTYRGGFKLDRFPEFRGSDYPFQSCTDRIPRAKIG